MYSCSFVIIASHVSKPIELIVCGAIAVLNFKSSKLRPVAENRSVVANRSVGEIAFLITVSCFVIIDNIISNNLLKVPLFIRKQFWQSLGSLNFKSRSKFSLVNSFRFKYHYLDQHRRFGSFMNKKYKTIARHDFRF